MNYKYLGNNNFEITLSVYRDDIRANTNAFLDDPAIIRIYDGFTEIQKEFILPFDSFLPLVQIDPCATIDVTERIDWTKYKGTINLPPNNNGYTIYYQRCCRNNSIANITKNPLSNIIEWGATYTINIPPAVNGQYINNTSPVFINYPPVYICVNKPITYNHAATDANGDRIVYSLCTPFSGADVADPVNNGSGGQVPNDEPPPFTNIQWRSPYSITNVLGSVSLTINPTTGLLSGTPNTVGQFVVGVCAEEYRNNVLLTRTIRDFQFNVVDCGLRIISSFFAPNFQCNNLKVNFTNTSFGATTYKWYFGDGDSSTSQNPIHTYSSNGNYSVRLVCNQGETCNSTSTQLVTVQTKKVEANFIAQNNTCLKQGDTIRFKDQSLDAININEWKWTFSNGTTSSQQNPLVIYNGNSTSIKATLTVNFTDSCSSTITKTIELSKKITTTLSDTIFVCADSVRLSSNTSNYDSIKWSLEPTFATIFANTPNIIIRQTIPEKMYYIKVNYLGCELIDSFRVLYNDTKPTISLSSTNKFCSDNVFAYAFVDFYTNVEWYDSRELTHLIGTNLTLQITQTQGKHWYYFKADYKFCSAIDSIELENVSIKYSKKNIEICNGKSASLNLNVQTPVQYDIIWFVNKDTFETNNISILNIIPNNSQTIKFSIHNTLGCEIFDSLELVVNALPQVDAIVDKPIILRGEQVQLNATKNPGYSYNWTPIILVSNAIIPNPTSTPLQNILFTVIIKDSNFCINEDTVSVSVLDYECDLKELFIPNAFSPNNDGENDVFKVRSKILKTMSLEVYNRWGNLIFKTDDINMSWDGTYKGQIEPAEVYGYIFSGECLLGEKITLKGNVTLLR